MARTKKVNDISLQLNLSTKRLFDAYLILAISDYQTDKKNKVTRLFKELLDKAMEEGDKYPHFSALEFDESIEFPSYFPKKKRIVAVISDEKQKSFLLEVQEKMNMNDYARYLFLKHFYGTTKVNVPKSADSKVVKPALEREVDGAGAVAQVTPKEVKKPIIKKMEYAEKKKPNAKKKSSRTNFGSNWIN